MALSVKELMIGDWVCYDGDTDYECPLKIDGLLIDDVSTEEDGFFGGGADCVIPIPLTPKILKANGFRESIEEGTYYFPNEYSSITYMGFAIETEGDGRWFITDYYLMPFRYVHEFQRVLRCCGLNELADNFKV